MSRLFILLHQMCTWLLYRILRMLLLFPNTKGRLFHQLEIISGHGPSKLLTKLIKIRIKKVQIMQLFGQLRIPIQAILIGQLSLIVRANLYGQCNKPTEEIKKRAKMEQTMLIKTNKIKRGNLIVIQKFVGFTKQKIVFIRIKIADIVDSSTHYIVREVLFLIFIQTV